MRPPIVLLALLALPAVAGADVVPLRHGTYVQQGSTCASPPFAAIRSWDGIGLADPHSHACKATLIARRGRSYTIANSCIDAGVGAAPRTTERLTITPTVGGMRVGTTTYAFCPTASLPPELRTRATR